MRTLLAFVFVCFSLQASAFDLDALNEQAAIAYYEYTASLPRPEIRSEDESIDPTIDWTRTETDPLANWAHLDYDWENAGLADWVHLDYEWEIEITASIPPAASLRAAQDLAPTIVIGRYPY